MTRASRLFVLFLIAFATVFAQSTPKPKHPKWHAFVHKVDKTAKITGEVVLGTTVLAVIAMGSSGTPIQIR